MIRKAHPSVATWWVAVGVSALVGTTLLSVGCNGCGPNDDLPGGDSAQASTQESPNARKPQELSESRLEEPPTEARKDPGKRISLRIDANIVAEVYRDGERLGRTPFESGFETTPAQVRFVLRAEGYRDTIVETDLMQSKAIRRNLEPIEALRQPPPVR